MILKGSLLLNFGIMFSTPMKRNGKLSANLIFAVLNMMFSLVSILMVRALVCKTLRAYLVSLVNLNISLQKDGDNLNKWFTALFQAIGAFVGSILGVKK